MRKAVLVGVLVVLGSAAFAQEGPITECDRLAGLVGLPRVEGAPGIYAIADPSAAVAACEAARAAMPDDPMLAVLLGRAQLAADSDAAEALETLTAVAEDAPALVTGLLGQFYEQGVSGLPRSEASARDFYERACDHWPDRAAAPGCTGLALMRIEGRGGDADETGGFNLLNTLCASGWGNACLHLALQDELRGESDARTLAGWLEAGCTAGDMLACTLLGFRHEFGDGVGHDPQRATDLYRRACEAGEPQGCGSLGEVYRSGLGVAPDIEMAVRYFTLGCDGWDAYACAALGFLFADGRGVDTDPARARVAFDRACQMGDPEACDMLLEMN
ncbi:tetratricopeptide repeat protein [Pararhodobacter sp.]